MAHDQMSSMALGPNGIRRRGVGKQRLVVLVCLACVAVMGWTALLTGKPATTRAAASSDVPATYGELPLSFETVPGGAAQPTYRARGGQGDFWFTGSEVGLTLRSPVVGMAEADQREAADGATTVRLQLTGARPEAMVEGLDRLPGVVNYQIGDDPAHWHTNLPTYARLKIEGVYPGIDLVYYGNQRQLEYDFNVAPGADPTLIVFHVQGVDHMSVDADWNLVLHTAHGELRQPRPVVYQEVDGERRPVEGGYALQGEGQFAFALGAYDPTRPLVIDPLLVYSTPFGGSGDDYGYGVAVDATGAVYITGKTLSTDFPTVNAADPNYHDHGQRCPRDTAPSRACYDIFVTKLNPAGTAVVYSTYLGTLGDDEGKAIAVDAEGNAYVTGQVAGPHLAYPDLYTEVYVFAAKLGPTGELIYASRFGSEGMGHAIAVDPAGRAYITGEIASSDLPTTENALRTTRAGLIDAFLAVLDPSGRSLVYSTYLAANGDYCGECSNVGYAVALDAAGMVYVAGQASPNFLVTTTAYQTTLRGFWDAFVTKLDLSQSGTDAVVYSTLFGGSGSDFAYALAVDQTGNVYLTGSTQSEDMATTSHAFDRTCGTDGLCNNPASMSCDPVPPGAPDRCHLDNIQDAFVVKLDPSQAGAAGLMYATYLGGASKDEGHSIAVDRSGQAVVVGRTLALDFPTLNAVQGRYGGADDGFVTKLNAGGSALVYSTFLGGGGDDTAYAVALDASGAAYVTGYTGSRAFPVANPLRPRSGEFEAFITKLGDGATPPPAATATAGVPTATATLRPSATATPSATPTPVPINVRAQVYLPLVSRAGATR